jgi:hypothetical protein
MASPVLALVFWALSLISWGNERGRRNDTGPGAPTLTQGEHTRQLPSLTSAASLAVRAPRRGHCVNGGRVVKEGAERGTLEPLDRLMVAMAMRIQPICRGYTAP